MSPNIEKLKEKNDIKGLVKALKSKKHDVRVDAANILKEIKGKNSCLKYFNEENIYAYIFNNMKLLKELKLDLFFLEIFLLL